MQINAVGLMEHLDIVTTVLGSDSAEKYSPVSTHVRPTTVSDEHLLHKHNGNKLMHTVALQPISNSVTRIRPPFYCNCAILRQKLTHPFY